ncbi:hypothetical protein GCM10010401_02350 [Rarobacter faecitabidus]|uniref:SAV-6107-like HEPN domain-containing protein n=2 Tax=Rarobacter faecitabidus TaxID=13243 RepID=A0A542ZWE7_RARFA|nr:hypothetical protein FB461_1138 [Rarobacter faecitabidus]
MVELTQAEGAARVRPMRHVPVRRPGFDLVRRAEDELTAARSAEDAESAYIYGHLAALRYAAAVLAALGPALRRSRSKSVWVQLADRAPQFAHWAAIFEESSRTRSALEAGLAVDLSGDQVSRCLRNADEFGAEVTTFVDVLSHSGEASVPHWSRERFAS